MAFDLEEEAIQEGSQIMMHSGTGVDHAAALAVCAMAAGLGGGFTIPSASRFLPGPAFAHRDAQHGEAMPPGQGYRNGKKKQRWSGRRQ